MSKFKSLGMLVLICSLVLTGCKGEEGKRAGLVKATPAYQEHFGEAPTPEEGTCFARVGFLPSALQPTMILPVPLFLFTEENQLHLLLERLLAMKRFYPQTETLYRSFPEGATLISARLEGGKALVDLDFSSSPAGADASALAACITETASQFRGVEKVLISEKGRPLPGMPSDGYASDTSRIAKAGNPRPLMIYGSWHEGALEEILIGFDRPVTFESIRLEGEGGREIRGEYYRSLFQMAVVVRPEKPGALREGVPLHLEWSVTDALGRRDRGEGTFQLQKVAP